MHKGERLYRGVSKKDYAINAVFLAPFAHVTEIQSALEKVGVEPHYQYLWSIVNGEVRSGNLSNEDIASALDGRVQTQLKDSLIEEGIFVQAEQRPTYKAVTSGETNPGRGKKVRGDGGSIKSLPSFEGVVEAESEVAGRRTDVLVTRNRKGNLAGSQPLAIEIHYKNSSPQERQRTRRFLRQGLKVCWVHHVDSRNDQKKTKDILREEMKETLELGVADMEERFLSLGIPISFDNYKYTIGPKDIPVEFHPKRTHEERQFCYGEFDFWGRSGDIISTSATNTFDFVCTTESSKIEVERVSLNDLIMAAKNRKLTRKTAVKGYSKKRPTIKSPRGKRPPAIKG